MVHNYNNIHILPKLFFYDFLHWNYVYYTQLQVKIVRVLMLFSFCSRSVLRSSPCSLRWVYRFNKRQSLDTKTRSAEILNLVKRALYNNVPALIVLSNSNPSDDNVYKIQHSASFVTQNWYWLLNWRKLV